VNRNRLIENLILAVKKKKKKKKKPVVAQLVGK
jgi:hypothetical protein